LASVLPVTIAMTMAYKRTVTFRHDEPTAMLRWVFVRGRQALTCEVRVSGRGAHDVCVVPHWNVSESVVERFDRATAALRRHAEIAWCLGQEGWRRVHEPRRGFARTAA
jgi:hypothetical protein